ncbi:MAG: GC-type dockerin domain-anchored protein [Planctomycetota bacterium]
MFRRTIAALTIAAGSLGSISLGVTAQVVVFDNGVETTTVDDVYTSDTRLLFAMADDFTMAEDTTITGIEWSGGYFQLGGDGPIPVEDDFVIVIYADDNGSVGDPVTGFLVGNDVNRTDSGSGIPDPTQNDPPVVIFSYSATIDFDATAGVKYWLSIEGNTPGPEGNEWGWSARNAAGGNSYFTFDRPGGSPWIAIGDFQPPIEFHFTLKAATGCRVDVTSDAVVDFFDVASFQNAVASQTPAGDFNNNQEYEESDVLGFLNAFEAGCP